MSKGWWLVLIGVGFLGVGVAGPVTWKICENRFSTAKPVALANTKESTAAVPSKSAAQSQDRRVDLHGDPLPERALTRIGTVRFRSGSSTDQGDAAFLSDSKTIVSVHGENIVYFWETSTGKELCRLEGPSECQKIITSLDGKKLAVVGNEEIWVWDLSTDPPRKCFSLNHKDNTNHHAAIAFASDSKMLALSCIDKGKQWVRLFNIDTGNLRQSLEEGQEDVSCMAFSPDSKMLAVDHALWNLVTGEKRYDLKDKNGRTPDIKSLAFSSNGKMLVATMHICEKNVHHYALSFRDAASGTEIYHVNAGDSQPFVAFLPDGQTLLQAADQGICLRELSTGKEKIAAKVTFNKPLCHDEVIKCLSQDGKFLAEATGQIVRIWDVATGREVTPAGDVTGKVGPLGLTPDGKLLATLTDWDKQLRLWETATGRLIRKLGPYPSGERRWLFLPALDYSEASRIEMPLQVVQQKGLSNTDQEALVRWDVHTGKASIARVASSVMKERRIDAPIPGYAVTPDGRWQLWGSQSGLTLVDRSGVNADQFIPVEQDGLRVVAVSGDGQTVLCCDRVEDPRNNQLNSPARIGVWSTSTGKQLMSVEANIEDCQLLHAVSLSPDGRRVAAVSDGDSTVRLWEVASGTEEQRFKNTGTITCVAWSPDGRLLTGGDVKGTVWLWDVAAGRVTSHFTGHRGGVCALAFSLDGLRLVSGSNDTTALVWDLHDLPRREIKSVRVPPMNDLWSDLRKKEAAEARQAMYLLTQNADMALPLLNKQLRPTCRHDTKLVTSLLAQLDNDNFQIRNQAEEQLKKMDDRIEPALEEALAKKPSLEVQQRIYKVREKISPILPSGFSLKQLQACRGVEVLERIGSPASQQILEGLSRLSAGKTKEEAKAALQRLMKSTRIITP